MFCNIRFILAGVALAVASLPATTVRAQGAPDFGSLVGQWTAHGITLDVASDGEAVVRWRAYTWCSTLSQPEPCDSIIGDEIVDGGLAMLRFTTSRGSSATALVLMSSDSSHFAPGSTATFQVLPGGVGKLSSNLGSPVFCGPNFDPTMFASSPCGL